MENLYKTILSNAELLDYLHFGLGLFFVSLIGIFVLGRDLITILIAFEILLLASVINFIAFSVYYNSLIGELFIIFILVIAAAETAIALSILVLCFRVTTPSIPVNDYSDFIYALNYSPEDEKEQQQQKEKELKKELEKDLTTTNNNKEEDK